MARSPFERCADRCWSSPSRPSSAAASTASTPAGVKPGIERVQDRDQAAHDHRVAVAAKVEPRRGALAVDPRREPDLAGAALDLGRRRPQRVVERRHRAAELDDVAVAVLPVVEEGEVVGDRFEAGRGHGTGSSRCSRAADMRSPRAGSSAAACGFAPFQPGELRLSGGHACAPGHSSDRGPDAGGRVLLAAAIFARRPAGVRAQPVETRPRRCATRRAGLLTGLFTRDAARPARRRAGAGARGDVGARATAA